MWEGKVSGTYQAGPVHKYISQVRPTGWIWCWKASVQQLHSAGLALSVCDPRTKPRG